MAGKHLFADELWAKSPPTDPAQQEGYPLFPHLLDVATVATCLLAVVPCPVELPMAAAWIAACVAVAIGIIFGGIGIWLLKRDQERMIAQDTEANQG